MSRKGSPTFPAANSSPAEAVDDGRSRTVLIVDDHDDVRHMLRLLFEVDDFRVVGEAADGDQALDLAREHQPAFVILDYSMPNMSGEQTARWIHLVDPEARIIAVSGVIRDPPSWAEAFVSKTDVVDLIQLPETLVAHTSIHASHQAVS
jgi:CheY-like chemotaxis protein